MDIAAKDNRIVWVDLEMTGLDPARHVIVAVAALVTDAELTSIDEGVDLVVPAPGPNSQTAADAAAGATDAYQPFL